MTRLLMRDPDLWECIKEGKSLLAKLDSRSGFSSVSLETTMYKIHMSFVGKDKLVKIEYTHMSVPHHTFIVEQTLQSEGYSNFNRSEFIHVMEANPPNFPPERKQYLDNLPRTIGVRYD